MGAAKIRKICTVVEETQTEMGRAIDPPTRKAVAEGDAGLHTPRRAAHASSAWAEESASVCGRPARHSC